MKALLCSIWLILPCLLPAQGTLWLRDLDLTKIRQDRGSVRSVTRDKPVSIAGRTFERGVAVHANSLLWLELDGNVESYSAEVGVPDVPGNPLASVGFAVMADGKWVWKSPVMHVGDPAVSVRIDLRGVRRVLLRVDNGGDNLNGDDAVWADAAFVVRGQPPVAFTPVPEKPEILTPPARRAPRINGARVFGVRPGSPFLFTVPATGERPLRFEAENLPNGLHLDPQSGRISGAVAAKGITLVTLQAANVFGTDRRSLKIVCGDTLALTPHMGWNSWYIWRGTVSDEIMRAAADAMVSSGLANHGYAYVNIDDCWAAKPQRAKGVSGRDARGRIQPNERFPDMKALTDYIHARGLKAGIYTSPGSTTCAACEGAFGHEAADLATFAEWGFDFLKYDWCSYGKIVPNTETARALEPFVLAADVLRRLPRDIVLNFNAPKVPKTKGGYPWRWGRKTGAQSWRTGDDLGAGYLGIAAGIDRDVLDFYAAEHLDEYGGPGGWNDPDYLLIGDINDGQGKVRPTSLTPNEQYAQFSLWCLVAAPLILSSDITRLDAFSLNVLGNDEVIDVDQDPLGKPGRRIARDGEGEVWARPLEDASWAVGLFNRGGVDLKVAVRWRDLGRTGRQHVRDLWRQKDLGTFGDHFETTVPPRGVVLIRIKSE